MTTISLRMDDQMKKELDEMCEAMGMNISTFYMIYTKKALRDRRIPFDIEAPADPFYSEQNMAQLRKSAQQVKEGKIITKPMSSCFVCRGSLYMTTLFFILILHSPFTIFS